MLVAAVLIALGAASVAIAIPLKENHTQPKPIGFPVQKQDTVQVPIGDSRRVHSITLAYEHEDAKADVIVLPCSDLSDPSRILKRDTAQTKWIYLVTKSVLNFTFDESYYEKNFSLWIVDDHREYLDISRNEMPCGDNRFVNSKCFSFSRANQSYDYPITNTSYYFIACKYFSGITISIDQYYYNFTEYTENASDIQMYSIDGNPLSIVVNSIFDVSSFVHRSKKCILLRDGNENSRSTPQVSVTATSTLEVAFFYVLGFGVLCLICAGVMLVAMVGVCVEGKKVCGGPRHRNMYTDSVVT